MFSSPVLAQVDIRPWLEDLFPGLSWEQAVAVLASISLIFTAALAIALSGIAAGQASAAGRPVVVRVPPPPRTAAKAPPAPVAVASAGGAAPGFGATVDSSSGGGDAGGTSAATSAASPADAGALPADSLPLVAPAAAAADPAPADDGATPDATSWPRGTEAYTVVIAATEKEDEAQGKVDEALAVGIDDVGYLSSTSYQSLLAGKVVVFGGSYPTLAAAKTASDDLAQRGYSEAQPIWISETRARRCEDGEQPRPADAPSGGDETTSTGARTRAAADATTTPPTTTGGDTTTTGGDTTTTGSDTTTTGGDTTTTGGGGSSTPAGDDGGATPSEGKAGLPVLEVPCEVRAADAPDKDAKKEGGSVGGPTANP